MWLQHVVKNVSVFAKGDNMTLSITPKNLAGLGQWLHSIYKSKTSSAWLLLFGHDAKRTAPPSGIAALASTCHSQCRLGRFQKHPFLSPVKESYIPPHSRAKIFCE